MARTTLFFAGAAAALACAPALAQPTGPAPEPLIRAGATEQVSPHVHVTLDEGVPFVPNVGFVVGDTGVLVIDTGLGDENGRIVLAEAQRLAPGRDLYIASTHFHPEHDLGAAAFPDDATMIRSADQDADIAEAGALNIERFATFSAANARLLEGASHRPTDVSFTDEHSLDLGGVTVRIIAMGPNHTRGDTAFFVEDENVLFSGDVAMSRQPAFATAQSSVSQWLTSLDAFEALGPEVVVPAHGPVGDVDFIQGYRAYLNEVVERTGEAKAGGASVEDATATVSAAMAERYPDAGRLAGAIRTAYAEAP